MCTYNQLGADRKRAYLEHKVVEGHRDYLLLSVRCFSAMCSSDFPEIWRRMVNFQVPLSKHTIHIHVVIFAIGHDFDGLSGHLGGVVFSVLHTIHKGLARSTL